MSIRFNIETIPLSAIDVADMHFRISDSHLLTPLINSIQAVGLLVPPLVVPIEDDRYRIASGFLRIESCRQLAMENMVVRIPAADTPAMELAWAAVSENALARELSVVEKARATVLLQKYHPNMDDLSKVAAKLGLMLDTTLARKLLRLMQLPDVVVEAVSNGSVAFTTALDLEKEGVPVTLAVTRLFEQLKIGLNHQRYFLQMIHEITRRDEVSITDLLAQPSMVAIVDDSKVDSRIKAGKVKELLYRLRYPHLSACELRFQETADFLITEQGVRFIPPPHFEGNTIQLTISFNTKNKLIRQSHWLQKILTDPAIDDLFD